jgi:cell division protein FtsB
LIFGENGFLRYVKLSSTKAALVSEIKGIKRQNEEIKKQIEALKKDPYLIEELARERGLTREGELIFKYYYEENQ